MTFFLNIPLQSGLLLVALLIPSAVLAQATTTDMEKPILLATVDIYNAEIVTQDVRTIQIAFELSNQVGIQPNVQYGVRLIQKDSSGVTAVFDEHIYDEKLTLGEQSVVARSITYVAPASASGSYELWLTSANSDGFPFAAIAVGQVSFTPLALGSVSIDPASCFLAVSGDQAQKRYATLAGVDIAASESLQATCIVINSTDAPQTLFPSFVTRLRTQYGEVVDTTGGSTEPIVLQKNERKEFAVILPRAVKPQSYDVQMSLADTTSAKLQMNAVRFHYVIQGPSATIQNVHWNKQDYQKDEEAQVSYVWSPSADNFEGSRAAWTALSAPSLQLSMTDGDGVLCAASVSVDLLKNPNIFQVQTFNAQRRCSSPQIVAVLKDKDETLATREFSTITPVDSVQGRAVNPISVILLSVVLFGLGVFLWKRKKQLTPALPGAAIFLMMLCAGFSGAQNAHAATWFGVQNAVLYTASLNKGTYVAGELMSISVSQTGISCANTVSNQTLNFNIDGNQQFRQIFGSFSSANQTQAVSFNATAPTTAGGHNANFNTYAIPFTVSAPPAGTGGTVGDPPSGVQRCVGGSAVVGGRGPIRPAICEPYPSFTVTVTGSTPSGGSSNVTVYANTNEVGEINWTLSSPSYYTACRQVRNGGYISNMPGGPIWTAPINSNDTYRVDCMNPSGWYTGNTVQFIVRPPNIAPAVYAGIDRAIQLPTYGPQAGATASDPDGSVSLLAWTRISGPAAATISGSATLSPSFGGMTIAGTYVFRLTATDNQGAINFDQMEVAVSPPPPSMPCAATTIANCVLPLTPNGSSAGSCTSGYGGACNFSCSNGTWAQAANTCVPPAPNGTLTTPSCNIAAGQSTCSTSISWSITNPVSPSVQQNGIQFSTNATNNGTVRTIQYGTPAANTFTLVDGIALRTQTPFGACAIGTSWNGSVCLPPPPPAPTMTPSFTTPSGSVWGVSMTGGGSSINCEFTRTSLRWGNVAPAMVGLTYTTPAMVADTFIGPGTLTYSARCSDAYSQWSTTNSTIVTVLAPVPVVNVDPPPGSTDFGSIPVGSRTTLVFAVNNTGETGSLLTGVASSPDTHFTCAPSCGYTNVPKGTPANITFTFTPTGPPFGSWGPNLLFTNTQGASDTVAVQGASISPLVFAPNPVDFGNVVLSKSKTLTTIIRNMSTSVIPPFTIVGISGDYSCPLCSTSVGLAPQGNLGDSRTISITYSPTANGLTTQTATLSGRTETFIVRGSGVPPVFDVREE